MSDPLAGLLARPVLEVAPRLLGATVTHDGVTVRLTEVEAYAGADDPGSHAHRGRTPRNAAMFGPAGRLYVYFTYGMHFCANVVTGAEGEAAAVLLRAGEVVDGQERARRGRDRLAARDLARGPARLTVALGLGRGHDGLDLLAPGAGVTLTPPAVPVDTTAVRAGPRVGVRGPGGDGDRFPWRFHVAGDATVSAYRPAAPRRRS
ncbi:DNA-3-methyladenine glycosylase [Phycicoccus sp. BSK3Z-2]|uniref:Putative 3-methyladenine DNA glycosylase n=1 Tax=Phycicoccus avicenniae TaxID=2828860 RepID=A0A941D900_9MICO|nr:DNA-3-methyladenine glycosylase [Phycicoccus avicenniae]